MELGRKYLQVAVRDLLAAPPLALSGGGSVNEPLKCARCQGSTVVHTACSKCKYGRLVTQHMEASALVDMLKHRASEGDVESLKLLMDAQVGRSRLPMPT